MVAAVCLAKPFEPRVGSQESSLSCNFLSESIFVLRVVPSTSIDVQEYSCLVYTKWVPFHLTLFYSVYWYFTHS